MGVDARLINSLTRRIHALQAANRALREESSLQAAPHSTSPSPSPSPSTSPSTPAPAHAHTAAAAAAAAATTKTLAAMVEALAKAGAPVDTRVASLTSTKARADAADAPLPSLLKGILAMVTSLTQQSQQSQKSQPEFSMDAAIKENEMLQVEAILAQEAAMNAERKLAEALDRAKAAEAERDALQRQLEAVMGAGGGDGKLSQSGSIEDIHARADAQRKAFQESIAERERALVELRQSSAALLAEKQAEIDSLVLQVRRAKAKRKAKAKAKATKA